MKELSKEFYYELEQLMLMLDEQISPIHINVFTEQAIMRQLGTIQYIYTRDINKKEEK